MLIGAGGFLFPFLPFWFSNDLNYLEYVAQATESPTLSATASSSFSVVPTPTPSASFNPSYPAVRNRLVIGKIGVNMPLFVSNNGNTLLKGGWVFPNTSTPDVGGNTVIFGHRFRYLPPISNTFYKLDKIKIGDEFSITWKGTTYRYRVRETKIIEPTDLSVMKTSETPIVTLITCAPLFSTKQRLVVIADLL